MVVRLMSSVEMDDLQASFNHHGDPAPKLGRRGQRASSTAVNRAAKSEGSPSDDSEGATWLLACCSLPVSSFYF